MNECVTYSYRPLIHECSITDTNYCMCWVSAPDRVLLVCRFVMDYVFKGTICSPRFLHMLPTQQCRNAIKTEWSDHNHPDLARRYYWNTRKPPNCETWLSTPLPAGLISPVLHFTLHIRCIHSHHRKVESILNVKCSQSYCSELTHWFDSMLAFY